MKKNYLITLLLGLCMVVSVSAADINNAPTIDKLAAVKMYDTDIGALVPLSGITDGDDNTQDLTVSIEIGVVYEDIISAELEYTPNDKNGKITITPKKSGYAVIIVTAKDNGGVDGGGIDETVLRIEIYIEEAPVISSLDKINNSKVNVFPNPATDYLNITSTEEISSVVIRNILGSQLINNSFDKNGINIKDLNEGVYFLEAKDTNGEILSVKRFIKK